MDEKKIKALISLLDDDDKEVLSHVENQIYTIGADIIPHLEEAWEDNFNPKLQKRIEDIIHHIHYERLISTLEEWKNDGAEDLLKGMWILSTFLYPDYTYEELTKDIEQLYYDIWVEFNYEMHPFDQIKVLNSVFFGKKRFRPNTKNFHAPNNSMINMLLETKKGNPISLSVLYMLLILRQQLTA